jgi:hypothetical protein
LISGCNEKGVKMNDNKESDIMSRENEIALLIINDDYLIAGNMKAMLARYETNKDVYWMPPVLAQTNVEIEKFDFDAVEVNALILKNKDSISVKPELSEAFYQSQWQYWNGDFPSANVLRQRGYGIWLLIDLKGMIHYSITRFKLDKAYQDNKHLYAMKPVYVKVAQKDYLNLYLYQVSKVINGDK